MMVLFWSVSDENVLLLLLTIYDGMTLMIYDGMISTYETYEGMTQTHF
jgi:hypothetical protein